MAKPREMNTHLQSLCKNYSLGKMDGQPPYNLGKRIAPNPHIDFEGFSQHLLFKTNKRYHTIRMYLSCIHAWNMPVDDAHIRRFEDNADLLFDRKEQGLAGEGSRYVRKAAKNEDKRRGRFKWNVAVAMKRYLSFLGNLELKAYMDSEPFLKVQRTFNPGRRKTPDKEYMTEDVFIRYLSQFPKGDLYRTLYMFMFYTGARISEALQMRKNKQWFDELAEDALGLFRLPQRDALLRISIPVGYAKTDDDGATQKLYIAEKEIRQEFVDWVNAVPHNAFVFSIASRDSGQDKSYMEISQEMGEIREHMRRTMLAADFETEFIEKFTIHSWRVSNIHYTQSVVGLTNETQQRARHASSAMTDYYLQTQTKHFEEDLYSATQRKREKLAN